MSVPIDDPADLFLYLYDELGDEPFDSHEVIEWEVDDWVLDQAEAIRDGVLDSGYVSEELAGPALENGPRGIFAVLMGLNNALVEVGPQKGTQDGSACLAEILERFREHGYLNSDEAQGFLLYRVIPVTEPGNVPDRSTYFDVIRVERKWLDDVDYAHVGNGFDLGDRRVFSEDGTVAIGCVAMMDGLDELEGGPREKGRRRFYRVAPSAGLADRIGRVLQRLDEENVPVGILPELSLSDELLAAWQHALRTKKRPRGGRLRWILIGTGPVGGQDPPVNRAVVLLRDGGHRVFEYDKQFDFTLTPSMLKRWCLTEWLGEKKLLEDIKRGRKFVVRESQLGRVAVLICEDLGRVADAVGVLKRLGVSHILVPVFDAPLELGRWTHEDGEVYASKLNAWVVVVNSLTIGRAQQRHGKRGDGALAMCCSLAPGEAVLDEYGRMPPPVFEYADAPHDVRVLRVRVSPGG
jgi:predicted amidohydrolase